MESKTEGTLLPNPTEYKSVVGALQYVTITRPDIAFAVNRACQFMFQPTNAHWKAVNHILKYLKGVSNSALGLLYGHDILTIYENLLL